MRKNVASAGKLAKTAVAALVALGLVAGIGPVSYTHLSSTSSRASAAS